MSLTQTSVISGAIADPDWFSLGWSGWTALIELAVSRKAGSGGAASQNVLPGGVTMAVMFTGH
jgi:hypothetical protein